MPLKTAHTAPRVGSMRVLAMLAVICMLPSMTFGQTFSSSALTAAPAPRAADTGLPQGADNAAQSWLFGADLGSDGNSNLFRINTTTGDIYQIASLSFKNILDLEFLPDGSLYGTRSINNNSNTNLVRINPRNGTLTTVGAIGFAGVVSLIAESTGSLLGATWNGQLVRINVQSGDGTLIGNFGGAYVSAGDLAFDDQGKLYGTVCKNSCTTNPASFLLRINPKTGAATEIGAIGFDEVYGMVFFPGKVLAAGGGLINGPTLFAVADGEAGNTPKLITINRNTGAGTLVTALATTDGMGGLAANYRIIPTRGALDQTSYATGDASNDCQMIMGVWVYCQNKWDPNEASTDGDDTYAWDVSLKGARINGEPIYAIADGKVVSLYGEVPTGGGSENTVLIEHCFGGGTCNCSTNPNLCWWSRYNGMENLQVTQGQQVFLGNLVGYSMDSGQPNIDDFNFALYEGQNRRVGGQGLLSSVDMVLRPDLIFADGFESGDTSAWTLEVNP